MLQPQFCVTFGCSCNGKCTSPPQGARAQQQKHPREQTCCGPALMALRHQVLWACCGMLRPARGLDLANRSGPPSFHAEGQHLWFFYCKDSSFICKQTLLPKILFHTVFKNSSRQEESEEVCSQSHAAHCGHSRLSQRFLPAKMRNVRLSKKGQVNHGSFTIKATLHYICWYAFNAKQCYKWGLEVKDNN